MCSDTINKTVQMTPLSSYLTECSDPADRLMGWKGAHLFISFSSGLENQQQILTVKEENMVVTYIEFLYPTSSSVISDIKPTRDLGHLPVQGKLSNLGSSRTSCLSLGGRSWHDDLVTNTI